MTLTVKQAASQLDVSIATIPPLRARTSCYTHPLVILLASVSISLATVSYLPSGKDHGK
jgi:hypothetical protein